MKFIVNNVSEEYDGYYDIEDTHLAYDYGEITIFDGHLSSGDTSWKKNTDEIIMDILASLKK